MKNTTFCILIFLSLPLVACSADSYPIDSSGITIESSEPETPSGDLSVVSDASSQSTSSIPSFSSSAIDPPQEVTRGRVIYRLKEDGTYEAAKSYDSTGIYEGKEHIVIEAELYGRPVTSIPDYGFGGMAYTQSFVLPDTIVSIGDYAFCECKDLRTFNIPSKLEYLGDFALSQTWQFELLTLPKTLKSLGIGTFWDCHGLRLALEEGHPSFVLEGNALYNADKTELLVYAEHPDDYEGGSMHSFSVPDSVRVIGEYSFTAASHLSEITIPSNVKTIESNAFSCCGFEDGVHLSEGLEEIGAEAFAYIGGEKPHLPSTVSSIGHSAFHPSKDDGPAVIVDEDHPFFRVESGCLIERATKTVVTVIENLLEYEFDTEIFAFGDYAFQRVIGLRKSSIILPNTLVSIGREAISYMKFDASGLPDSLQEIGYAAFISCGLTGGTTLSVGENVSSIGLHAFQGIYDMDGVSVDENNPYFSDYEGDLYNKDKTILLQITGTASKEASICDTTVSIAEEAGSWARLKGTLVIPESVKTIERNAFYDRSIAAVYLPRGIDRIEEGAFYSWPGKTIFYPGTAEEWANVDVEPGAFHKEDVFEFGIEPSSED